VAEPARLYAIECSMCDEVFKLPDPTTPVPGHAGYQTPMQVCDGAGEPGRLLDVDSGSDVSTGG
jgi:hypothetical protein